jgi:hypothetical protein
MGTRRKPTFEERLVESAREAARIERGEAEPGRVTRYTVAEAEVAPPPRYAAVGSATSVIIWSCLNRCSPLRSM